MKTNIDWPNFDTQSEINAMSAHIIANWDGLSEDDTRTLMKMFFHKGWYAAADHFTYCMVDGKQVSPSSFASERRKTMIELGYTPQQRFDDQVTTLLHALGNLQNLSKPLPDFSDSMDIFIQNAKDSVGAHVSKATPKMWRKKLTDAEQNEILEKSIRAFDGSYVSHPCVHHFVQATSLRSVKYGYTEQGRSTLQELLGAAYAHALLLRIEFNNALMGRELQALNPYQKYVPLGEKVKVANCANLKRLLSNNVANDADAAEAWELIEWVSEEYEPNALTPVNQ